MSFFVFADRPTDPAVLSRAHRIAGGDIARHASGNPWTVGRRDDSDHVLTSTDGVTRVRGTLSTSAHVFWGRSGDVPVASGSVEALVALLDPDIDEVSLALSLVPSLPILPFATRTMWSGIQAVPVGHLLEMPAAGGPRTVRWWEPPGTGRRTVAESAEAVRAALLAAIGAAAGDEPLVSADLSGGLDSTSICYLLAHLGQDFLAYRTSSMSRWNDETARAHEAAADLGVEITQFPPLAELSSAFDTSPVTDSALVAAGPIPWVASRGYLDVLSESVAAAGSRVHFTGLGGDELFDVLPAQYRALWQENGARSLPQLRRIQLNRKVPLRPFLRGVTRGRPYAEQLAKVAGDLRANRPPEPADQHSWFPVPVPPRWVAGDTRALAAEAFTEAARAGLVPLGATEATHQMMEAVAFQGAVIRQFGEVYARHGISWQAPFIDQRVVEAVLGVRVSERMDARVDKPLLAAAMAPVMPPGPFAKQDRGDFTLDIYDEHEKRRDELLGWFDDSLLVERGLVDAGRLRPFLHAPSFADVGLIDLENVVGVERWLRAAVSRRSAVAQEIAP
ncbi:asparagine synthase-related protein [Actinoplanes sp. NPDC051861]|uniref:asparagine synthase-related protein n=1 Tax=Actinoplanes sp. NPDC051861 TaxID=3155170 RepID=UPI003440C8D1